MIRVGKIVATHGLQGAVIFTHVLGDRQWLKPGAVMMVEMHKGSQIPFFVKELKSNNSAEYVVNFEDVATVEAAKKLVTKHVYVDEDILSAFTKDTPLLWIGFNVTDVNRGLLGPVTDVMQTPGQWLGKVMVEGKEVLVPLLAPVLREVNLRNRRIIVEMPAGLIDVYLS
jgi:16S rRNA processing protein RimM